MLSDDSLTPAPAKVLYSRETGFTEHAPPELRKRQLDDIPDAPEPRPLFVPKAPSYARDGMAAAREKARKVGKRAAKAERTWSTRGGGWNRNEAVTVERILELKGQGLSTAEIAAELRCRPDMVTERLLGHRRTSPELEAEHAAKLVCECRRPKAADADRCHHCTRPEYNRQRREERAAARKERQAKSREISEQMHAMKEQGMSTYEIAAKFGSTKSAVCWRLRKFRGVLAAGRPQKREGR